MDKHIVIVDVQSHFLKSENDYNNFDFTEDRDKIVNFLKRNRKDISKLSIVMDTLYSEQNEESQLDLSYNLQENDYVVSYLEKISDEEDEFFENLDQLILDGWQYFQHNVDPKLVIELLKLKDMGVEIIPIEKQYGYFRDCMDTEIDVAMLIAFIKKEMEKENGYYELETYIEEVDNPLVKDILNIIEEHYGLEFEEISEKINFNHISEEEINIKYSHIRKDENILLCGGGACECLLEEYVSLKTGGWNNFTLREDLIYGEVYEMKQHIESLNEQKDKINKLILEKNKDFENDIGISK